MKNIDNNVVNDFGKEWKRFNHLNINKVDLSFSFGQYFNIFPMDELNTNAQGFDMGCGSGRWAKFIAPKVGILNCVEPSKSALKIAKKNLLNFKNVKFYNASVCDDIIKENSQDFGYCLGVLHHVPDTLSGIKSCAKLLKKDAPFLLYLYYNFENKSFIFQNIWKISNILRIVISRMPKKLKFLLCSLIAIFVYWPIARTLLYIEKMGINVTSAPLNDYRKKPFYFMNNDALDRFGTRIEKRFSKKQIINMLEKSDFKDINFSENTPFWVCIARKA